MTTQRIGGIKNKGSTPALGKTGIGYRGGDLLEGTLVILKGEVILNPIHGGQNACDDAYTFSAVRPSQMTKCKFRKVRSLHEWVKFNTAPSQNTLQVQGDKDAAVSWWESGNSGGVGYGHFHAKRV